MDDAASPAPASDLCEQAQSRLRILVVDDCADQALSLCLMLNLLGHQTQAASSGVAALEVARVFSPQVVFLDIAMPKMDGYELATALRRSTQQPYLVAVTGYGRDQDRRLSYVAGCDVHLLKPIDAETIMAVLARVPQRQLLAE